MEIRHSVRKMDGCQKQNILKRIVTDFKLGLSLISPILAIDSCFFVSTATRPFHLLLFGTCYLGFVYNVISATVKGPGYLPLRWKPSNAEDVKGLKFCTFCNGYKAPRSHHCRRCGRCIQRFDHHCFRTRFCIGYNNQLNFTLFILFASVATVHSMILYLNVLWKLLSIPLGAIEMSKLFMCYRFYMLVLYSISTACSIALLLLCLLLAGKQQVHAIFRNQTNLERKIMRKAVVHQLIDPMSYRSPYDLGWWTNTKQLFCSRKFTMKDGSIDWPVTENSKKNEYLDLQAKLEDYEMQNKQPCLAVADFSANYIPFSAGIMEVLTAPYTEPKLKLHTNERINVIYTDGYWSYGEKLSPGAFQMGNDAALHGQQTRGWFPVKYVARINANGQQQNGIIQKRGKKQEDRNGLIVRIIRACLSINAIAMRNRLL